MTSPVPSSERYTLDLETADSLRHFRNRFHVPQGVVYLDGNSLGLLSRDAERTVLAALELWKAQGIAGWLAVNPPWFTLGEDLGAWAATGG